LALLLIQISILLLAVIRSESQKVHMLCDARDIVVMIFCIEA